MLNPFIIGLVVFLVVRCGAPDDYVGAAGGEGLAGRGIRRLGGQATPPGASLGLLISNANTSFTAVGGQVTALSAQILRLDQILRRYGPATAQSRELLREYAQLKTVDLFPDNPTSAESVATTAIDTETKLFVSSEQRHVHRRASVK
jgi:hypothetical protein